MVCEAVPTDFKDVERTALRSVESLRHLPVAVEQLRLDGSLIEQNPTAIATFGGKKNFKSRFVDEHERDSFFSGEEVSLEARLRCQEGDVVRWFLIQARRGPDPVTGEPVFLASSQDIDSRKQAELVIFCAEIKFIF